MEASKEQGNMRPQCSCRSPTLSSTRPFLTNQHHVQLISPLGIHHRRPGRRPRQIQGYLDKRREHVRSHGDMVSYSIDGQTPVYVRTSASAGGGFNQQLWKSPTLTTTQNHQRVVEMIKVNNNEGGNGIVWFDSFAVNTNGTATNPKTNTPPADSDATPSTHSQISSTQSTSPSPSPTSASGSGSIVTPFFLTPRKAWWSSSPNDRSRLGIIPSRTRESSTTISTLVPVAWAPEPPVQHIDSGLRYSVFDTSTARTARPELPPVYSPL
ncbi:hypothetical protein CPC08DRAFT_712663 [Agrocybe pediades]|nr:hypothetical protein CPC08DRAFT_712663 [Agrocybe pediades]